MNETGGESIDKDTSLVQEGNKRTMLHGDTGGAFPSKSLISFTFDKIVEPFFLLQICCCLL